ncbi:MAG: hypothetical protein QXQ70_08130 [Candidatus Caldarchaeum sp.]
MGSLWVEGGRLYFSYKEDEESFSFPAAASHAIRWGMDTVADAGRHTRTATDVQNAAEH